MQNHNDSFDAYDENSVFELAVKSVLGDREEQQDNVGYEIKPDEGMVVVCDGMGGMNGGKLAGEVAVDTLLKAYLNDFQAENTKDFLIETVGTADKKISQLCDEGGNFLKAGSTVVAVVIKEKSLHWVSVGDSRMYLFRAGETVRITTDHNYQNLLDKKMSNGNISEDEYNAESRHGEALVSFLGINGLPQIDVNEKPFELQKDDRILLMSDGLYKLVGDDEIARVLSNFANIEDSLNALEQKARKSAKHNEAVRDNMTLALIKIK